jgi:adenylate cyclase
MPPTTDEQWAMFLAGGDRSVERLRRFMGRIPKGPRCKLCNAPFSRPGSVVMRLIGYGPSRVNRRLCRMCIKSIDGKPGGAEIEITVLFADVRGSTGLAEGLAPGDFSRLMARFYGTAARIVDNHDGIVDKFVGDEIVALFIPGFAGADHAADAIAAAQELLEDTGRDGLPVGAGVHTGSSFVGTVGEGDAYDFTALGDTVNAAARLGSLAQAGELLVSDAAATAGALDTTGLDHRTLELRGREQTLDAWIAPLTDGGTRAA